MSRYLIDDEKSELLTAGQTQYGLTKAWYGNYNNEVIELGGNTDKYVSIEYKYSTTDVTEQLSNGAEKVISFSVSIPYSFNALEYTHIYDEFFISINASGVYSGNNWFNALSNNYTATLSTCTDYSLYYNTRSVSASSSVGNYSYSIGMIFTITSDNINIRYRFYPRSTTYTSYFRNATYKAILKIL